MTVNRDYNKQETQHTLQRGQVGFVQFRMVEHHTNRDIVETFRCDERTHHRSAKERRIVAICLNQDENPTAP
jgi:hypothetical protein